ncbi:MAG: hypothetical protein IKZ36_02065 [Kiritimatiellae bacterium]|nr:hypothetical protein [Kiritimatiellia bacterium]
MGENGNKKHQAEMMQYASILARADMVAKREFDAWQAKYLPVEREILAARSKREESKRRRAIARKRAFADLCEMTEGLAVYCHRKGVSLEKAEREMQSRSRYRRRPHALAFLSLFEDVWTIANFVSKELTKRIDRVRHEAMRPHYYAQERARRQSLAEERRRIRKRRTLNPCPTREELLDAWTHIKDSPEALLRFGSLMEDLECYVDNSLRRTEDGVITGRRSGIKGWLQIEIPALYLKYTTVMAHKAAAKRMRQILEVNDPVPLSMVLDAPLSIIKDMRNASKATKDYGADEIAGDIDEHKEAATNREGALGNADNAEVVLLRARALYLEVMRPVGEGSRKQMVLLNRLWSLTDPEKVEDANMLARWREKYKDKIMVRTKSMWLARLGRYRNDCSGAGEK